MNPVFYFFKVFLFSKTLVMFAKFSVVFVFFHEIGLNIIPFCPS